MRTMVQDDASDYDIDDGVYFDKETDKALMSTYGTTVIPYHGAWLEYETDNSDVFYVRIDKNRKLPVTLFL